MRRITRGLLADGIATTISGAIGAFGMHVLPANIAVVAATGIASRRIGYAIATVLVLLCAIPGLTAVLVVMPRGVMAATLVFSACFILVAGLQIITSRLLDGRRTIVVGASTFAFLAAFIYPAPLASASGVVGFNLTAPLLNGLLVALILNVLFREHM
jgi:xanthine permease XanP